MDNLNVIIVIFLSVAFGSYISLASNEFILLRLNCLLCMRASLKFWGCCKDFHKIWKFQTKYLQISNKNSISAFPPIITQTQKLKQILQTPKQKLFWKIFIFKQLFNSLPINFHKLQYQTYLQKYFVQIFFSFPKTQ